ncbi:MAG: uncharacterized protein K0S65_4194 [Labilithrix sp.]|nr:uncharacterized protein [Labilithrix sp.]
MAALKGRSSVIAMAPRCLPVLLGLLVACSTKDRANVFGGTGPGTFDKDGGVAGDASDTCAKTEVVARKQPVDIIMIVDGSGSMGDDEREVTNNLNKLSTFLEATELDYRIVLISGNVCIPPPLAQPNCQSNGTKFLAVRDPVDSVDTLEIVLRTLERSPGIGGAWKDFLRPDALKVFIPITDDNSRLEAEPFDRELLSKPGGLFGTAESRRYRFYPIAGAETYPSKVPCWSAMNNGSVYLTLAELTKGKWFPVCAAKFAPVFDSITQDVAAAIACELPLPTPEDGSAIDPTRVNATIVPSNGGASIAIDQDPSKACSEGADGWQYNADKSRILLCGSACEKLRAGNGARLVVEFGCATRVK